MTTSEAAMMGRQSGDQASLFYEFRLDERIPKDHLPISDISGLGERSAGCKIAFIHTD